MNKTYDKYMPEFQKVIEWLGDRLQLELTLDGQGLRIVQNRRDVLFKTNIHKATVLQAIHDCQTANAVLLADYIPQAQAEALADAHVNFIDTWGNCYLTGDGLRVLVTGKRPPKPTAKRRALGKAFEREGLKVTFAALLHADQIGDLTVRAIRDLAGVGIGTVHYVLKDLKDQGYLRDRNGRKVLHNRKELLMEWAKAYRIKLRPKLLKGVYAPERDIMTVELEEEDEAAWGCEMAANKLGAGLWPGFWTIYAWGNPNRVKVKAKLTNMPNGTVELLTLWFRPDGTTVPPLLAYADLITSGNARNLEAALELEEKYNLFG
jgi:hypothetical protein